MQNPMNETARPADVFAEAYRFEPQPDITAFELALIVRDGGGGREAPSAPLYVQTGTILNPAYAHHFVRAPGFDQVIGRAK